MDDIFRKIWLLAKPFYQKGRPMDVDHIEWMMNEVEKICEAEKLDISLLMPLAILHDVGYSKIKDVQSVDYYGKDTRKAHMIAGAEIASEIFKEIKYPKNKADKIIYYVSVHDNWAFGEVELYVHDSILGTFKDLDYLWIFTPKGFDALKIILKKNDKEMIKHLQSEPSPIYGKKPFSNKTTKNLHDQYLLEREKEVKHYEG